MSYANEATWESEKDPLELIEDIYIKEEKFDIKQEPIDLERFSENYIEFNAISDNLFDIKEESNDDSVNFAFFNQPGSSGIKDKINFTNVLQNKSSHITSNTIRSKRIKIIPSNATQALNKECFTTSVNKVPSAINSEFNEITDHLVDIKEESNDDSVSVSLSNPSGSFGIKKAVNVTNVLQNKRINTASNTVQSKRIKVIPSNTTQVLNKKSITTSVNKVSPIINSGESLIELNTIKDEILDIKEESSDDSVNIIFSNRSESSGIKKAVNVTRVVQNKPSTNVSKAIGTSKKITPVNKALVNKAPVNKVPVAQALNKESLVTSVNKVPPVINSVINQTKESVCNCMRYVEFYCSKCNETSFYRKDKTQCQKCKTLLKLQCKNCLRRFKFLSSSHQFALKYSKQNNLLSTPDKKIKLIIQPSNKKIQQPINKPPEKVEVFSCTKCEFLTSAKYFLDKHMQNLHKVGLLNANDDDDQFIELQCSKCKKTCKRIQYDEDVKQVCRECQQEMRYRCTLCYRLYVLLKSVRYHVRCACFYRINQEKLFCDHCDYKTEVKSRLEFHIKSLHMPRKCSQCDKVCKDYHSLKNHVTNQCPGRLSKEIFKSKDDNKKDTEKVNSSNAVGIKRHNRVSELLDCTPNQLNKDDTFTIIRNNPEDLINRVNQKKTPKDLNSAVWKSLIDYYCMQCDIEASKKFSKSRPTCPKCKGKFDYRCINCEKLYGGYTTIIKHINNDCQNRYTWECVLCDYDNTRRYIVLNHIKSNHTIYRCLRCSFKCQGYLGLRKHQATNCQIENPHNKIHVEKLIGLYCKHCYKRSNKTNDDELVACGKCTMIMNFQCLKCNILVDNHDAAYKHVEECKPAFHCSRCDYKAFKKEDLDVHIKYQHTSRTCIDCGLTFKDEQIFKMHRNIELKKQKQRIIENEAREKRLAEIEKRSKETMADF